MRPCVLSGAWVNEEVIVAIVRDFAVNVVDVLAVMERTPQHGFGGSTVDGPDSLFATKLNPTVSFCPFEYRRSTGFDFVGDGFDRTAALRVEMPCDLDAAERLGERHRIASCEEHFPSASARAADRLAVGPLYSPRLGLEVPTAARAGEEYVGDFWRHNDYQKGAV